ncbi:MAG: 1-deoxy-D-xylulose-5-phosphate synthase, partial [Acidimicrobiia bacterium]|nr:1-deoxy-D-xylulose-5-phosphate synthase [Acidimicrobiia bacterium]
SCTVINARWVKPLDPRLEQWAADHSLVVTIEDNVVSGGFGAAVLEALSESGLAGRVRVMGIPDRFIRFGGPAAILAELGLDGDGIVARVRELAGDHPAAG